MSVKSGGDFADILAQDNPDIWRSNRPAQGGDAGKMFERSSRGALEMRSSGSSATNAPNWATKAPVTSGARTRGPHRRKGASRRWSLTKKPAA